MDTTLSFEKTEMRATRSMDTGASNVLNYVAKTGQMMLSSAALSDSGHQM